MPRPSRSCAEKVSYAKDIFIRPRGSASGSDDSQAPARPVDDKNTKQTKASVQQQAAGGASASAPSKVVARGKKRSKPVTSSGNERAERTERALPNCNQSSASGEAASQWAAPSQGGDASQHVAAAPGAGPSGAGTPHAKLVNEMRLSL